MPRSPVSHSLPNLRPSTKRSSRPSSSENTWRVILWGGSARAGCTTRLPVMPRWATRVEAGCPEPVEGPAKWKQQVLGAAPHAHHRQARHGRGQLLRGWVLDRLGPADVGAGYGSPGEPRAQQAAAHAFDFGKFRQVDALTLTLSRRERER